MQRSKIFPILLFASISLLTAVSSQAQGIIVPGPCNRCPVPPRPIPLLRSLPVKSIKIDAKIASQVATSE